MLADLLKIVTPEALVTAMKGNPKVVQATLQKFEAYAALGEALTLTQQVCISSNLNSLDKFFKTDTGKTQLSCLAEKFVEYVNQK